MNIMKKRLILLGTILFIASAGACIYLNAGPFPAPPAPGPPDGGMNVAPPTLTTPSTVIQPGIGVLTANPDGVFSNVPTLLTFTCEIPDPRIIPTSVNLQQLDSTGRVLGNVSIMNRNSAQPTFYETQINIHSPAPTILFYRVSAALKGILQRAYSRTLPISITSLQPSTWLSYHSQLGYSFKYPSNWFVVEATDGTVTVSRQFNTQTVSGEGAYDIIISYERNSANVPLRVYFNGVIGSDLFTDTQHIYNVVVDSVLATRFVGPAMVPSDEVVIVPFESAFLVISSSAPSGILELFLAEITLQ